MKKILLALGLLAAVATVAWALPKNIVLLPDGSYENAKTGQKTDADGNVLGSESSKDRDLDFGVTNLIASVAIDSGGTGGANFRYSAPVDVRQYTSGNIIIHITVFSSSDTVGVYDYGVTVFPLTSATLDWTATGVPIVTNGTPSQSASTVSGAILGPLGAQDSSGFWRVYATNIEPMQGERRIRLQTARGNSNYRNTYAATTVSLPWSYWLGIGFRPRYLAVQVRLMAKTTAVAGTPSVRVDLEGLR